MTFLIFDTSAIGAPRKWSAEPSDTFNWPRMVHIAWELYDKEGKLLESDDYIVKPDGFDITSENENMHGISYEMASENGKPLKEILEIFSEVIEKAEYVISHNLTFNQGVVGAEYYRKNLKYPFTYKECFCLMQESTWFCKLPGKQGRYKWPTLTELFMKLFGAKFEGANNAKADVLAASASFFRLLQLGQLDDMFDDE